MRGLLVAMLVALPVTGCAEDPCERLGDELLEALDRLEDAPEGEGPARFEEMEAANEAFKDAGCDR